MKESTKMWDVFLDDMGLDSSIELALANLDFNDPLLEPVTFDDSDPLEGSSSTPADIDPQMDEEEEESSDEFVDSGMEEDKEDLLIDETLHSSILIYTFLYLLLTVAFQHLCNTLYSILYTF